MVESILLLFLFAALVAARFLARAGTTARRARHGAATRGGPRRAAVPTAAAPAEPSSRREPSESELLAPDPRPAASTRPAPGRDALAAAVRRAAPAELERGVLLRAVAAAESLAGADEMRLVDAAHALVAGEADAALDELQTDAEAASDASDAEGAAARWRRVGDLAAAVDPARARKAYREAAFLTPEDGLGWALLGRALLAAGETSRAETALRRAAASGDEAAAQIVDTARSAASSSASPDAATRGDAA